MDLGIGSAIAAPVRCDDEVRAVRAVLYLDARGRERHFTDDAAAFCEALASRLARCASHRIDIETAR